MQGQTSSTGSGILHLKCKWLVVAVAGKKKGYSLVYELQQMRKMDSWVEIQEKKKKSTKIIENMKAKMKERGSSLKYRISLCFFFPFKWNQFSSLGWQQQDSTWEQSECLCNNIFTAVSIWNTGVPFWYFLAKQPA